MRVSVGELYYIETKNAVRDRGSLGRAEGESDGDDGGETGLDA